jgi:hypothetical protein
MFEESAKLLVWVISVVLLAVIILPQMIRILREYERGVIFRLGKLLGTKGPGLIFLIPFVDRMVRTHDPKNEEVGLAIPKPRAMADHLLGEPDHRDRSRPEWKASQDYPLSCALTISLRWVGTER